MAKDYVYMHIEYRPSQHVSTLVKLMMGPFFKKITNRIPKPSKRYWSGHFWALGFGCWSTGNITDEMVNQYLEQHRNPNENKIDNFIIED